MDTTNQVLSLYSSNVMMTKEGCTKIVNFMESVAGFFMVRCGHLSHCNDYGLSSTLLIYSTLIAIILREYNVAFLFLFLIFIYSMIWTVDMQI